MPLAVFKFVLGPFGGSQVRPSSIQNLAITQAVRPPESRLDHAIGCRIGCQYPRFGVGRASPVAMLRQAGLERIDRQCFVVASQLGVYR